MIDNLYQPQGPRIRSILVANRSEIAIRVFRAASEMGIRTVGVYAEEDKLSLHRFKCDEAYHLGAGAGPVAAYLDMQRLIDLAVAAGVDAVHPGYGFLSENPEFAERCAAAGLIFVGPTPDTMRRMGDKVSARAIAAAAGVPVVPATPPLPHDDDGVRLLAAEVGYPLMLKASWGGGGRGMRPVEDEAALLDAVAGGRREAKAAFSRDEVFLERLVRRARHVEVQLLGDTHGNLVHLFERDCSIQRRNQKVIERAPAPYLDEAKRRAVCDAALRIGRISEYVGAGTVEFLLDEDSNEFYFIEVNPRIQVEHTVTEVVTGIDIVKAQIAIAQGGRLSSVEETGVPAQADIALNGHAIQCRITTEDPANGFIPDYGRITAYRGAFGFGIRVDNGTAYSGAIVTRHYDSLLEKVVAWAPTPAEAVLRMARTLSEYRIRGVATNLAFLTNVLRHPDFLQNRYTTRFIDDTPELLPIPQRQDRATRLLTYIAEVTVNGHPEVHGRPRPAARANWPAPSFEAPIAPGTRQRLTALGAAGFARWMREQPQVLLTDTTMRDAHQSLLATRVRTRDMVRAADAYARGLPQLLSVECWGGATFDVAMRFLHEDPWERLYAIRERAPNILTQMLLRGANGVGYTNYPDNVVRRFIAEAAKGVDLFRIFDCFNWVDNMRVAIDAVLESGKIAEGAMCYTGDILDPARPKHDLAYYLDLARRLDAAGCHVLAIKDMAGLLKPQAARVLIRALRDVTDLPIHLHTHDTSGAAAATLLAAVDEGVDAVDAAIDAMSGATSQPCLGAIVEALRHGPRDSGIDPDAVRRLSSYWGSVRGHYAAFEGDLRSGASEVYQHEMPGGQLTNLKEQARSLGLDRRWHEVAVAYAQANMLFGDIVKVTPSSKVVGDMALMMVAQALSPADILDGAREIAFPASVVEMLRGDLGQPHGGWPHALQRRVLRGEAAYAERPAARLEPLDLAKARAAADAACAETVDDQTFTSYLMYPEVTASFVQTRRRYGTVSALDTQVFFYGMVPGEELTVDIERGKTLSISLQTVLPVLEDGQVRVYFELNGQPRIVSVADRSARASRPVRRRAERHGHDVGAPMPGLVSSIAVGVGDRVHAGDALLTLEAMKMETVIRAPLDAVVAELLVRAGEAVEAKDLLVVLEGASADQA